MTHYSVEGRGRDYDYALFCEKHNNEAVEFASEWLAERFDAAEPGDTVDVTMHILEGPPDECVACARTCPSCFSTDPAVKLPVGEATHGVDPGEPCFDRFHRRG